MKSVEKAEVKTVEVSGYKLNDSVDAASTTYKYNANADSIKGTSYNVGKQATLVLDKYGYIIAVESPWSCPTMCTSRSSAPPPA